MSQAMITSEAEEYQERFQLAKARILEIRTEIKKEDFAGDYLLRVTDFLSLIFETYESIQSGLWYQLSLRELQQRNQELYADIAPQQYDTSYANPDYATAVLGSDFGPYLCALYAQMRGNIAHIFEGRVFYLTISCELFLEIYTILRDKPENAKAIHDAIYFYCFDYADVMVADRTRELLDPSANFFTNMIREADLTDLRYLYHFGEYVSENEYQTAEYLNTLSLSQIQDMAKTFTEGYREGFQAYQIDLSRKGTVNIRYVLGFERVVAQAMEQFSEMGLDTCIYRTGVCMTNRSPRGKIGFYGGSVNKQYDYDHRMDDALFFDKAYADRRLCEQKKAYESMKNLANLYAGPAVMETFGEHPFTPLEKESAPHYSPKQQKQKIEYQSSASLLLNEYIPGDETSFTIIAYPVPEIGQDYDKIFAETIKVNTLDQTTYREIQTKIIEALDQGPSVTVTGRGSNQTNLTIALTPMTDPSKQTRFENCLADVNIPLGEVFTSPLLSGTNGVLHVTKSFLNGLRYDDIRLTFQDGIISDYDCKNFEDSAKNKKYMKDNLLFQHNTLPMGEFAIGTNTTAYAMGQKYHISHLLPILIEEKTGPHFAIGDTCFSHEEEMRTFNPDGKEMIAKENDFSRLRKTDPSKAYFNCHTDITIPYHELGDIWVNKEDGTKLMILSQGRFVLNGTEVLNEPLDESL